jgi:hypothetical protein
MDQNQINKKNLSWREAIIKVLETSNKPMSTAEIVDAIKQSGLRNVTGDTPEATVGAVIYTSMKKDGESSPFIQPGPNQFQFNPTSKFSNQAPQPSGNLIATNDEEEPAKNTAIIRAFGMYWKRDFVYWKTAPRILGSPIKQSEKVVDFCNQRGVYFLHDGSQLVYVGRSVERSLGIRLYEHTIDRLNGRWDRFSWFGLLNFSEDGKTVEQGLKAITANGIEIIETMEALLIEGLEPKQNRKSGDNKFRTTEQIQVEDPEITEKKIKEVILEKLLMPSTKLTK